MQAEIHPPTIYFPILGTSSNFTPKICKAQTFYKKTVKRKLFVKNRKMQTFYKNRKTQTFYKKT